MYVIKMIVPNSIKRRISGAYSDPELQYMKVTEENIKKALDRQKEYHEDWYIESEDVKVVEVRKIKNK